MVRDEDKNVSIWMKENIRVKESAKNERWREREEKRETRESERGRG